MHGKAGDDAVNPLAPGGSDSDGLRGVELVEDGRQAGLRKALNPEVTLVGDFADDEAGLVDGSDNQAMRRAAADGYDNVAEVVGFRIEHRDFRTDFRSESALVTRKGGRFDE